MSLLVCSGCSTRYAPGLERCPHCGGVERVEEGGGGSLLPYLDVTCPTVACPAVRVRRVYRVYLRSAGPGVVEMPAYGCAVCGAPMAVVSMWRTPPTEEESMPKITRHGGATNAADEQGPPAEQVEGSEPSSPGSSSETSLEKPPTSPATSETDPPKPARTTASRSKKARTASSTASSTDGSGAADAG